jgi:hypothetical protein
MRTFEFSGRLKGLGRITHIEDCKDEDAGTIAKNLSDEFHTKMEFKPLGEPLRKLSKKALESRP